MKTIEKMDWNPKYSVDIKEIDDYQKQMFELFNELIDMEQQTCEAKEYINMLARINEYSRLYFSAEEQCLRRNGYPDFGEHAKIHRQFTKSFISLRREISNDVTNLNCDVIHELRSWLIAHILEFDSLYIPFLRLKRYIKSTKN